MSETRSMMRGRLLAAVASTWSPTSVLFLRFAVVGLLNAGFGYSVFALFVIARIPASFALVGAMLAGVAFNFQTSRRLVFRSSGHVLRFVAVYVVVLVLNWASLRALRACGLSDLVSQAVLTLPAAAVAFLGQQRFVFGPAG